MAEGTDSLADRMKQARIAAGARRRPPVSASQDLMAEWVGKELGRTMHTTQWRRYEGGTEPPLDVIRAAARLSGLPEAYLAFGIDQPDRLIDPMRDRKLTEAEEQRALRAADERRKAEAAPPPKAKKRGAGDR